MKGPMTLLCAALAACGGSGDGGAGRAARARELVPRLEERAAFEELVALGAAGPLIDATRPPHAEPVRRLACVALGRIGGAVARDRLLEVLKEVTRDPAVDGPMHLYAAAGLTLLADPGTAIDLIENLSTVNPNDYLAGFASEEREEPYYPVDAQLCEALLAMGLWNAEEDLVRQLRRRDKVRVLIDAHAVLRRRTGLDLPFRYNGSYDDRNADADAWLERLRATRPERARARPFRADEPRFRERCAEVVDWLGGPRVILRLAAHKILDLVGEHAVPLLVEALQSENPVSQRQAAYVLGRIGARGAAGALRAALAHADADARAQALDALRKVGDAGALGRARELLGDADTGVRAAAADFLHDHGEAADLDALRDALGRETAPAARTRLLRALLRHGDEGAVRPLVQVFVDGEQLDREAALAALEEAAGKSAGVAATDPREAREAAAARITEWFPRH